MPFHTTWKLKILYRETFSTATGTTGVRVNELKPFAIQTVGKIKRRSEKIQEAFLVDQDLDPFIFEIQDHT
jgi:hypothetical protein